MVLELMLAIFQWRFRGLSLAFLGFFALMSSAYAQIRQCPPSLSARPSVDQTEELLKLVEPPVSNEPEPQVEPKTTVTDSKATAESAVPTSEPIKSEVSKTMTANQAAEMFFSIYKYNQIGLSKEDTIKVNQDQQTLFRQLNQDLSSDLTALGFKDAGFVFDGLGVLLSQYDGWPNLRELAKSDKTASVQNRPLDSWPSSELAQFDFLKKYFNLEKVSNVRQAFIEIFNVLKSGDSAHRRELITKLSSMGGWRATSAIFDTQRERADYVNKQISKSLGDPSILMTPDQLQRFDEDIEMAKTLLGSNDLSSYRVPIAAQFDRPLNELNPDHILSGLERILGLYNLKSDSKLAGQMKAKADESTFLVIKRLWHSFENDKDGEEEDRQKSLAEISDLTVAFLNFVREAFPKDVDRQDFYRRFFSQSSSPLNREDLQRLISLVELRNLLAADGQSNPAEKLPFSQIVLAIESSIAPKKATELSLAELMKQLEPLLLNFNVISRFELAETPSLKFAESLRADLSPNFYRTSLASILREMKPKAPQTATGESQSEISDDEIRALRSRYVTDEMVISVADREFIVGKKNRVYATLEEKRHHLLAAKAASAPNEIQAIFGLGSSSISEDRAWVLELNESELIRLNLIREFLPQLVLPTTKSDYDKNATRYEAMAQRAFRLKQEVTRLFHKAPKIEFKDELEFESKSEAVILALRSLNQLAPGAYLDDLGMNLEKRFVLDAFEKNPTNVDGFLKGLQPEKDFASAITFKSVQAVMNEVERVKLDLQSRINKLKSELKVEGAWNLFQLQAFHALQKEFGENTPVIGAQDDSRAFTLSSFRTIFKPESYAQTMTLLMSAQRLVFEKRLVTALKGNDWKPVEGISIRDQLKTESDNLDKALGYLLQYQEFAKQFSTLNGNTGVYHAPAVEWAEVERRNLVKHLVEARIIVDEKDPKIDELLEAISGFALKPRLLSMYHLPTDQDERVFLTIRAHLSELVPIFMNSSDLIPAHPDIDAVARQMMEALKAGKFDYNEFLSLTASALAIQAKANISLNNASPWGVSIQSDSKPKTSADSKKLLSDYQAQLAQIENIWRANISSKISRPGEYSELSRFIQGLNDRVFSLNERRYLIVAKSRDYEQTEAQRKALREGGSGLSSSSLTMNAWMSPSPVLNFDRNGDVATISGQILDGIRSIEIRGVASNDSTRKAAKAVADEGFQYKKHWKDLDLNLNIDRSAHPEIATPAEGLQKKLGDLEQVAIMRSVDGAGNAATQVIRARLLQSDVFVFNFFQDQTEAGRAIHSWFLTKTHDPSSRWSISANAVKALELTGIHYNKTLDDYLKDSRFSAVKKAIEKSSEALLTSGQFLLESSAGHRPDALDRSELQQIISRYLRDPGFASSLVRADPITREMAGWTEIFSEITEADLKLTLERAGLWTRFEGQNLGTLRNQLSHLRTFLSHVDSLFGNESNNVFGLASVAAQYQGLGLMKSMDAIQMNGQSLSEFLSSRDSTVIVEHHMSGLEELLKLTSGKPQQIGENSADRSRIVKILSDAFDSGSVNQNLFYDDFSKLVFARFHLSTSKGEFESHRAEIEAQWPGAVSYLKSQLKGIQSESDRALIEKFIDQVIQPSNYDSKQFTDENINIFKELFQNSFSGLDVGKIQYAMPQIKKIFERIPPPWYKDVVSLQTPYLAESQRNLNAQIVELSKSTWRGEDERYNRGESKRFREDLIIENLFGPKFTDLFKGTEAYLKVKRVAADLVETSSRLSESSKNPKLLTKDELSQILRAHLNEVERLSKASQAEKDAANQQSISDYIPQLIKLSGLENSEKVKLPEVQSQMIDLLSWDSMSKILLDASVGSDGKGAGSLFSEIGLNKRIETAEQNFLQVLPDIAVQSKRYGIKVNSFSDGLFNLYASEAERNAKNWQTMMDVAEREKNPFHPLNIAEGAGEGIWHMGKSAIGAVLRAGDSVVEGLGTDLGLIGADEMRWFAGLDEDGNLKELSEWDPRNLSLTRDFYLSVHHNDSGIATTRILGDIFVATTLGQGVGVKGVAALRSGSIGLAERRILERTVGGAVVRRQLVGASVETASSAGFWSRRLASFDQAMAEKLIQKRALALRGAYERARLNLAEANAGRSWLSKGLRSGGAIAKGSVSVLINPKTLIESAAFTAVGIGAQKLFNPSVQDQTAPEMVKGLTRLFVDNWAFFLAMEILHIPMGKFGAMHPNLAKVPEIVWSKPIQAYIGRGLVEATANTYDREFTPRLYDRLARDDNGTPIFENEHQELQWNRDVQAPEQLINNAFMVGYTTRPGQRLASKIPFIRRAVQSPDVMDRVMSLGFVKDQIRTYAATAPLPKEVKALYEKITKPVPGDRLGQSILVKQYETMLGRRASKEEIALMEDIFREVFDKAAADGLRIQSNIRSFADGRTPQENSPVVQALAKLSQLQNQRPGTTEGESLPYDQRAALFDQIGAGAFVNSQFEGRLARDAIEAEVIVADRGGKPAKVYGLDIANKFTSVQEFRDFLGRGDSPVEIRESATWSVKTEPGPSGEQIRAAKTEVGGEFAIESVFPTPTGRTVLEVSNFGLKFDYDQTGLTPARLIPLKDASVFARGPNGLTAEIRIGNEGIEAIVKDQSGKTEVFEGYDAVTSALKKFGVTTYNRLTGDLHAEAKPGQIGVKSKDWEVKYKDETGQTVTGEAKQYIYGEHIRETILPNKMVTIDIVLEDGFKMSIPYSNYNTAYNLSKNSEISADLMKRERIRSYEVNTAKNEVTFIDKNGFRTTINAKSGDVRYFLGETEIKNLPAEYYNIRKLKKIIRRSLPEGPFITESIIADPWLRQVFGGRQERFEITRESLESASPRERRLMISSALRTLGLTEKEFATMDQIAIRDHSRKMVEESKPAVNADEAMIDASMRRLSQIESAHDILQIEKRSLEGPKSDYTSNGLGAEGALDSKVLRALSELEVDMKAFDAASTPDAKGAVIRGAYLRLVRKYHEGVDSSPEAQAMMSRINSAKTELEQYFPMP